MSPSDQVLLARFVDHREGDCFAELVRRHGGMVYGVCRRVLKDRALAEDAAQETFLHLLRQPAAVTDSLVGWLHRVAHGKAVDLVRREAGLARRAHAVQPQDDEQPTWATISPLFDEALQELPVESRQVLVSHYLEARSQQDLAVDLGISQPTVSRRLAAGVAQLRALLIAKGVVASAVVASLLQGSLSAAVPQTLATELGKITLAGQAGLGAGAFTATAPAATQATVLSGSAAASVSLGTAAVLAITLSAVLGSVWMLHGLSAGMVTTSAWRFVSPGLPAMVAEPVPHLPLDRLGDQGPARMLTLTRVSGRGEQAVVGVSIAPDWTIMVASNVDLGTVSGATETVLGPPGQSVRRPASDARSQVAQDACFMRLAPDGRSLRAYSHFTVGAVTVTRQRVDDQGYLYISGINRTGGDLGGGPGRGGFVAKLSADAGQVMWIFYAEGIVDFTPAAHGDLLVVHAGAVSRYDSATGLERWHVAVPGQVDDHPILLGYDARSDVTMVAGSRGTSTGDESFLQPYATAIDASGHPAWQLWNADPHQLRSGAGGLHLTADGLAKRIVASDGAMYLAQISTGGNTVLSHDAHDPARALEAGIHAGVHQDTPGFGFSGPVPVTSVCRIDPGSGAIGKQTWISAWKDPAHASAWSAADICADAGIILAVGESAAGGPVRGAWGATTAGDQHITSLAGGCVALFDRDMRLLQSGSFPQVHWTCAAMRGEVIVVAGHAEPGSAPVTFHALPMSSDGDADGMLGVFARDPQ